MWKQVSKEIVNQIDAILDKLTSGLCSLELEKEKIKAKIRDRLKLCLNEEFEGLFLWQMVAALALIEKIVSSKNLMTVDFISLYTFEKSYR